MTCYAVSLSLSHHRLARPFRDVGLGKSHSLAGVRSSISPAQGSQASTAKTPAQGSQASTDKTPAQGRQASTAKAILLKAGRPPRSHISSAFCSPTDRQLCRPNSLNGQPHYLVCNFRGYTCALGAQPWLFLIWEDEINEILVNFQ